MRIMKFITTIIICLAASSMPHRIAVAQGGEASSRNSFTSDKAMTTSYTDVNRDNLLNGLQIVTLERATDQSVSCDIVIRTGSMFDLTGKTGLAILTQESMLAANPRLRDELESLGARIEWGVNWDTTWFHIDTPANTFDSVIEIIARLLIVENIRTDAFKKTVQDHLEKLKTIEVTPAQMADQMFYRAVYNDHPYGHSVHGTAATISNIKQGDIYEFIRRFYVANNASVIVAGGIQKDRVLRTFKVFFGGWIKGEVVPATFRPPRQIKQVNLVKSAIPEATMTELRAGMVGVRIGDPAWLTSEIMARILTSRIRKSAEASSPNFTVQALPRVLPGPFMISASLPAEAASGFSQLVTDGLAMLAQTAVTNDELQQAKSEIAREYEARSMERNLRDIEVYSLPRNYPLSLESKINSVTTADVLRVAKKMFEANALTVVVVGKVNDAFKTTP